jgi:hypothetical protein
MNMSEEFTGAVNGLYHKGKEVRNGIFAIKCTWLSNYHPSQLHFYLLNTIQDRFLYCQKGNRRKSFNFFFWAVPFDGMGWFHLGLSLLGLTLVLRGKWLQVFGALFVRQSCSSAVIDKNRVLILFILGAIVLTCAYESIISATVIVPPPILVARTLKELLDRGYSIYGWDDNTWNGTILSILRVENISYSSPGQPPFLPLPTLFTGVVLSELYSKCNVTVLSPSTVQIELYQDKMDLVRPGLDIKCHFLEETTYPNLDLVTYSGYSVPTFHRVLNSWTESGIMDMLHRFETLVSTYKLKVRVDERMYREGRVEIPFELKDPKILSIFIATGILLVGGSLVFMVEIVTNKWIIK